MKLLAIKLSNIRTFSGEHELSLHSGLNVVVGRNNSGKSTILNATPLVARAYESGALHRDGTNYARIGTDTSQIELVCAAPVQLLRAHLAEFLEHLASKTRLSQVSMQSPKSDREISLPAAGGFGSWNDPHAEVEFSIGARAGRDSSGLTFSLVGERSQGQTVPEIRWNGRQYELVGGGYWGGLPQLPEPPDASSWFKGINALFADAPIATWASRPSSIPLKPPRRRVASDDESAVKDGLQYLRMRHSEEHFAPLAEAVMRAMPEFGKLDFTDEDYTPSFVRHNALLTRELVGSGAWSFLSLLTAARIAKATGAGTFIVDEPHLYLHPSLERRLVRELTDPSLWRGAPLQVIAATHSPAFLDAAWRNGNVLLLDWIDPQRSAVHAHALAIDDRRRQLAEIAPGTALSDLLYADRVVFVEGGSDREALRALTSEHDSCGLLLRFEALMQSDRLAKREVVAVLQVLARGSAAVAGGHRPTLILDADKKAQLVHEWDKWGTADPREHFVVLWAGRNGHDLESLFICKDFLTAFLADLGTDIADAQLVADIDRLVEHVTSGPGPTLQSDKASQRLSRLLETYGGAAFTSRKVDLSVTLAKFYIGCRLRTPLRELDQLLTDLVGSAK